MPEPRFRLPGDPARQPPAARERLAGHLSGARALLGRLRNLHPPELARQVVELDKLDATYFAGLAADWPRLAQLGREGQDRYPAFPDLLTDIFFGLFHWRPRLRTREQLLPSHRGNFDLLSQAMRLQTWELAREKSRINEGQSMIGLALVARLLLDAVPPEALAAAAAAAAQEQQLDDLEAQLQDLEQQLEQTLGEEPGEAGTGGETGQTAPETPGGESPEPAGDTGDAGDESDENDPGDAAGSGAPGEAPAAGTDQPGSGGADQPGPGGGSQPGAGKTQAGPRQRQPDAGENQAGPGSGGTDEAETEADGQSDGQPQPGPGPAPAGEPPDGAHGDGGEADGMSDDELAAALEAIDELLAEAGTQLDQIAADPAPAPQIPPDLARNAARQGLEQADAAMERLAASLAGFGSDSEELNALPIGERMAIAEKLTTLKPMRELADEIGRQRQLALDAARQPGAIEPRELVGVEVGGRVSSAMPGELALLGHPILRQAFYYKLGMQALLEREYAGDAPAGRGPAVILLDSSGSMLGPGDLWSKAFVLGMLEICALQERDLAVIWFDYDVHPPAMIFPKGRATLQEKLSLAERFHGGGTNYRPALAAAIANVEDSAGDWSTADIVLVTDGVSDLDEAFTDDYYARCQATGTRTHGVLVDVAAHYVRTLEAFCDQAWAVSTAAGNRPDPGPLFRAVALKGKPAPRPQR